MNQLQFPFYSTAHLKKLKQQLINEDEFEKVIEIARILRERQNGVVKKSLFTTEIEAIDRADGKLKRYMFVNIEAYSFEEAEMICVEKFPYATVMGKLIAEISEDNSTDGVEYEDCE